MDESKETGLE